MSIRTRLMKWIVYWFLERPASKKGNEQLLQVLTESGVKLSKAFKKKNIDSDLNRKKLAHIIGVERWGQNRLSMFLDEPLIVDESDSYQPDSEASWDEMQKIFQQSRKETISLGKQMIDSNGKVWHNSFGELSAPAWIYYLFYHADNEGKRVN